MIIEKLGLGAIQLPMGLGVLEPAVLVSASGPCNSAILTDGSGFEWIVDFGSKGTDRK